MKRTTKAPSFGIKHIENIYKQNPTETFVNILKQYNEFATSARLPLLRSTGTVVNYLISIGLYKRGERTQYDKNMQVDDAPILPPRGWKKKVAQAAGCSEKTVYNALRGNIKGPQANKVWEAYKQVCGKVTRTETV